MGYRVPVIRTRYTVFWRSPTGEVGVGVYACRGHLLMTPLGLRSENVEEGWIEINIAKPAWGGNGITLRLC